METCPTTREMRAGPSEPVCRSRLQTNLKLHGLKAFVVSVEEKAVLTVR